eukprot:TRINITY_DN8108_c0_g1_i1.p1 TRINITY_DN8108_c0_g1~~TRINITY_DN8108_c0_g1_i1.p1  ORF type:complete len:515 (-),score=93.21 TRINITY_DN8108_c0_g1_i1:115-1659(-)
MDHGVSLPETDQGGKENGLSPRSLEQSDLFCACATRTAAMGALGSSAKPKASVTVHLDEPGKPLLPGNIVTGVCVIRVLEVISNVSDVSISLQKIEKTHWTETHHYTTGSGKRRRTHTRIVPFYGNHQIGVAASRLQLIQPLTQLGEQAIRFAMQIPVLFASNPGSTPTPLPPTTHVVNGSFYASLNYLFSVYIHTSSQKDPIKVDTSTYMPVLSVQPMRGPDAVGVQLTQDVMMTQCCGICTHGKMHAELNLRGAEFLVGESTQAHLRLAIAPPMPLRVQPACVHMYTIMKSNSGRTHRMNVATIPAMPECRKGLELPRTPSAVKRDQKDAETTMQKGVAVQATDANSAVYVYNMTMPNQASTFQSELMEIVCECEFEVTADKCCARGMQSMVRFHLYGAKVQTEQAPPPLPGLHMAHARAPAQQPFFAPAPPPPFWSVPGIPLGQPSAPPQEEPSSGQETAMKPLGYDPIMAMLQAPPAPVWGASNTQDVSYCYVPPAMPQQAYAQPQPTML